MRVFPLAAAVAALLVPAAPALAGDPIMPLWQVRAGMQCTGYSVIQGTEISSFDVRVLDVAAGEATSGGGRILFEVSGPAVDATGLGPGFSGSPIYCPDDAGTARVIGAIVGVDQRVRRQGRAGDADRGDHRDAGRRARAAPRRPRRRTRRPPRRRTAAFERSALGADAGRAGEREADGVAADRQRRDRAGRAGAHGRRREGRAAGADRAARAARLVPGADAAARLGGRGRVLERRHPHERGRHRGLRGRRPRVGLRPPARSARAGARCCSRTPTSSGSSTTRTSSARSARPTSSPPPGTTSARSRRTASAPSPAAPARSRTPSRSR